MNSSNPEYSPRYLLTSLARDLRVLLRIILVVIFYWTVGWVTRRIYHSCERSNDTFWVDEKISRGIWKWDRKEDVE